MSPYKDPVKRREHDRARRRKERSGAVESAAGTLKSVSDPLPERPTVADLSGVVASEINKVRAAKADTLVKARTVGYLAGVLLKSLEVGTIEERLKTLEDQILKNERR